MWYCSGYKMLPAFLTEQYPLEKHLFFIPRFALGAIGIYPETERTTKVELWGLLNFVILVYGSYAEFYYGIYYLGTDIPLALDALCPVASSIMSLIKMFFIWRYQAEFKGLIEKVQQLTQAQDSNDKTNMKKKYFIVVTRLNALVLFFGIVTSTAYTLRPLFTNVILYIQGEDIIYETPFKMMFPEALLSMPLYPITYMLVHWHGYITVFAFTGTDGLFLGFSVYFATLLNAIQQDCQNILSDNAGETGTHNESEEQVYIALKDIVKRHNEISKLSEECSQVMVEITLCEFITSSIIIAMCIVDILLLSGYGIILYVVHTCAVFTEIFLYCLGGHTITESSEDIADKVYCTYWYAYSVRIQKMVLLIIVRSRRTISIKVPFFAPSLPALSAILRFTGSVITLAKSVI